MWYHRGMSIDGLNDPSNTEEAKGAPLIRIPAAKGGGYMHERPAGGLYGEEPVSRRAESRSYGRILRRRIEADVPKLRHVGEGMLTPEEGQEIVGRAEIDGDPLLVSNGEKLEPQMLTRERLLEAELEPTHEMELEGVKFGFSEVFLVDGMREAVAAYVEKDEKVYVRSYYRSGTSAMWRYLPDRVQDEGSGEVTWYGVGHSEEALTLPSEIQAALNDQSLKTEKVPEEEMTERERYVNGLRRSAFYGTAKALPKRMTRENTPGKYEDALEKEVDAKPEYAFRDGVPPEHLLPISDGPWPDYESEQASSEGESPIYGHFTARTYDSIDKRVRWTIMEDDREQAWVGQIETKSPITSTGLRKSWMSAGGFRKSLYEYPARAGSYGDYDDVKLGTGADGVPHPRYVSMWKNYLSKIALIREYGARRADGLGRVADRPIIDIPEAEKEDERHEISEESESLSEERERQKRKIVAYFITGRRGEYLSKPDIVGATKEDTELFLDMLKDERVTADDKKEMLRGIRGPVDAKGADKVFEEEFAGEEDERRILAYMTGKNFGDFDSTDPEDLRAFLEEYPTPIHFMGAALAFLQRVKEHSMENYARYKEAMESFKKKIYGKKYEYYLALKELEERAILEDDESDEAAP